VDDDVQLGAARHRPIAEPDRPIDQMAEIGRVRLGLDPLALAAVAKDSATSISSPWTTMMSGP
jgi:hypothetical protein